LERKSVYFPNLNSLRFFAALIVILSHIKEDQSLFGLSYSLPFPIIEGRQGVYIFFVLSGFLITYLLMMEYDNDKRISIKKFYMRRILRIWPLYFLIVLSSFFIIPNFNLLVLPGYPKEMIQHHVFTKLVFYLTFFPNLAVVLFGAIPFAAITWSIGVEEQFYLIWPWLLKYAKNKFILMSFIILFYPIIGFVLGYFNNYEWLVIFKRFWEETPINCMAIGGVFSLICYSKDYAFLLIKKIIFAKEVQVLTIITTLVLLLLHIKIQYFKTEIFSTLFSIIIVNLALNDKRVINLEYKWLSYLGKISYGLYVYHGICIVIVIRILSQYQQCNNLYIYSASLLLTIGLGSFSYYFFEKPFISLKTKFSPILSGGTK